jgi:hypothetical protein
MGSWFRQLLEYCAFVESIIVPPSDSTQMSQAVETIYEALDLADEGDNPVADILVASYEVATKPVVAAPDGAAAKARALLDAYNVEQRSEAWYRETMDLLTASELGTIFKSPRVRGQLVLAKTVVPESRGSGGPVDSVFMTPFDWGIRFEPVVKQLYEARHASRIADVGRLRHPTLARCAASPDGIVIDGSRAGRLVEIKCPVSRAIDERVPDDYYAQIQQQLEVCDLDLCDYVEAKFRAPYSSAVAASIGPAQHYGVVWRVDKEVDDRTTSRYIYGPIDELPTDPPDLDADEMVMERVVWELMAWNEILVARNRSWWEGTLPKIEAFWADVEAARRGAFVLPEPKNKRARPTATDETCLIVKRPMSTSMHDSECKTPQ